MLLLNPPIILHMDNKALRRANLRLLRTEAGGTWAELARIADVNQAYLTQVDRSTPRTDGSPTEMGDEVARRLETGMKKPVGWMDHDHSSPDPEGHESQQVRPVQVRTLRWDGFGGKEGMLTLNGAVQDEGELVFAPPTAGAGTFALKVQGDSMMNPAGTMPSFPDGSIIIVDPTREPESGSPVIVKLADAPVAVFKILEIYDGKRYLKPINPHYPPMAPMPDDALIVGRVISLLYPF